jgi:UDP-2,4-diacetamido-2,4,6-trideoxy-beta-L-altropyranose hydrolase
MNLQGASVALRTDASPRIGTGHVMRMLTLADALRDRGAHVRFIARTGPGDMLGAIRARGHEAIALPGGAVPAESDTMQDQDAAQTLESLPSRRIDLLACDHYGLGRRWHAALRGRTANMLVVDDLADREHDCDMLLDQNLGRAPADYDGLLPRRCRRLVGPAYAMLRPQFARARAQALQRRIGTEEVRRVLVSLGGADLPNATCRVLESLAATAALRRLQVDVVMGAQAPWLDAVRTLAADLPMPVQVHVGVADMAELMLVSDVAVGAAGGSAWERCCLALPTLVVLLADNQRAGAHALSEAGAACLIGDIDAVDTGLGTRLAELCAEPSRLQAMAVAAAGVTDGLGVSRVLEQLEQM